MSRHAPVAIAVLGACILAGVAPLLLKFFLDLWTRPQYDFFPLVLFGAAYLAWDRTQDLPRETPALRHRLPGALLLAASFALTAVGTILLARWFGAISAWIALAGFAWWIGGKRAAIRLLPALVLLAVIIPPPMRLDEQLALTLRAWAVWASGRLLDLLHVPHVINGTLINIAGRRLGVEEACSGINSLMAVIAVTILLGFWWQRAAWRIAVLGVVAVIFVVWANVLRIVIGAMLLGQFHIDILSGSAHALLGLVLFILCVAMTSSLDQFLELITATRRVAHESKPLPAPVFSTATAQWTTADNAPPGPAPRRPAAMSDGLPLGALRALGPLNWAIALSFLALGIITQAHVGNLWRSSRLPGDASFTLPVQIAGFQRIEGSEQVIGRPELLGQHSTLWSFQNGPLNAMVGFDYTFPGYHDLLICYSSSGWTTRSDSDITPADGGPFREIQLERTPGAYGYLLYGLCDEDGRWQPRPHQSSTGRAALAMRESRRVATSSPLYQVQVLVQGYQPFTEDQKSALRQFFLLARQQLAAQLVHQVLGR